MKKTILNSWLMAALVAGLSLGVTSCKDDDDKDETVEPASTVSVDAQVMSHGVEAEMKSAVVDVTVESNGEWTATLPADVDWVMIKNWQVTYNGRQTLTLLFDENNTGTDRTTTLTLGDSYGDTKDITVRQTVTVDGKVPTNSSALAFAGHGLGCGIDYDYVMNMKKATGENDKFQPTKVKKNNNIFNFGQIEKLIEEKRLQPSAYREVTIPLAELTAQMIDSTMVKTKNVTFNLKMSVTLGAIKFKARANYIAKKKEENQAVNYTIARNAPIYNVVCSPAELRAYASDPLNNEMNDKSDDAALKRIEQLIERYKTINTRLKKSGLSNRGLTAQQERQISAMEENLPVTYTYGGVFSANFTKRYNELYTAIVDKKMQGLPIDKEKADNVLNMIDNDYGPFFISGGDFGGNITVFCTALDNMLDGSGTFNGSLGAAMDGVFQVSGDFKYSENGLSTLHTCNPDIMIYGGSADVTATNLMNMVMGKELVNREKWLKALTDWVASMYTKDGNKPLMSEAAPISFVVDPIWTLFDDPDIQKYAQDYFINKYTDRGIKGYLGIGLGNYKPSGEDLLNKNSDFWTNMHKDDNVPLIDKASTNAD